MQQEHINIISVQAELIILLLLWPWMHLIVNSPMLYNLEHNKYLKMLYA